MSDPRVFFAAERTLLAWVRSGLTMMAFGFVVARFGLFLGLLPASSQSAGATHHVMVSVPQVVIDTVNEVITEERQERIAARPRH